jgi:hypothetical protein
MKSTLSFLCLLIFSLFSSPTIGYANSPPPFNHTWTSYQKKLFANISTSSQYVLSHKYDSETGLGIRTISFEMIAIGTVLSPNRRPIASVLVNIHVQNFKEKPKEGQDEDDDELKFIDYSLEWKYAFKDDEKYEIEENTSYYYVRRLKLPWLTDNEPKFVYTDDDRTQFSAVFKLASEVKH